jgi:hypothetical protein
MKNWLRNKMHNFIFPSDAAQSNKVSRGSISVRESDDLDGEPLRFNIFRANGGTVVQTHIYDRQKDRRLQQLHIVGHDQDLGESLNRIITMESLRG